MNPPRAMQRRCDRRFRYNLKPKPALISWRSLHHALRHRLRRRHGRWRHGQRYTCAGAYHLEDDTDDVIQAEEEDTECHGHVVRVTACRCGLLRVTAFLCYFSLVYV